MPDQTLPQARSLGQVIAIERTLRQQDNDEGARIKRQLAKEAATLGQVKIYAPDDPENEAAIRELSSYTEVQLRVEDELDKAASYAIPAINATATKDRTNTTAEADIIVDGEVLVPKVPISHLLWLEHYLQEWHAFLKALPTLSPTRVWEFDAGARVHRARTEFTPRNLKETVPLVLHPGNEHHAPQTTTTNKEVHVGQFETTVLSGAIPESRKRLLVDRCAVLEVAVKDAIARANRTPVTQVSEGSTLMKFIIGR